MKHGFISLSPKVSNKAQCGSILGSLHLKKARLSKSVGKVMSIIFCDTKGTVLNHMVPDKTIVNGDYYSGALQEQL